MQPVEAGAAATYDVSGEARWNGPEFDGALKRHVDKDTFQSHMCAEQLKALSEPLRLRIVDLLRQGPMTVSDIAAFLEVEVVTASHHLGILKHAQLLKAERDGRYMYYRLREELLQKSGGSREYLNLGCCRLEVPKS